MVDHHLISKETKGTCITRTIPPAGLSLLKHRTTSTISGSLENTHSRCDRLPHWQVTSPLKLEDSLRSWWTKIETHTILRVRISTFHPAGIKHNHNLFRIAWQSKRNRPYLSRKGNKWISAIIFIYPHHIGVHFLYNGSKLSPNRWFEAVTENKIELTI